MAGALTLDPQPLTVGELITAFEAHEAASWDHTAAMLSSWSGKHVQNPYRAPPKPKLMVPEELYAIQKAVEARKRDKARA